MAYVCLTCTRAPTSDDNTYTCDGFCKRWANRACLGGNSAAVKELTKAGSLFLWMCPECTEIRRSGRSLVQEELSSSLAELRTQLTMELESRLDAATSTFKCTILTALDQRIMTRPAQPVNVITSSVNHRHQHEPLAPAITPSTESANPAKRRLVDRSPPTAGTAVPLLTGTTPISTPSHAALLLPPEAPKFWLYLSRFRPTATSQEVQAFVKEQIGIEDVIVIKLVPANRDLNTLTFTSFKVGMSLGIPSFNGINTSIASPADRNTTTTVNDINTSTSLPTDCNTGSHTNSPSALGIEQSHSHSQDHQ